VFEGSTRSWDDYAERLRVQLPAAPEALLDAYVKWAPWLAIVFGGLSLLFLLGLGLLGAVLSPFLVLAGADGINLGVMGLMSLVLGVVASIVEIVGGYKMLQLSLTGWWLAALGLIVSTVSGLLSFNLFGLVITLLIAYVHLQVKPRYR
jgi:hypothetical protein